MKAKEIKELISFISDSGLNEVNIETEEIKLHVKKTPDSSVVPVSVPQTVAAQASVVPQPTTTTSPAKTDEASSVAPAPTTDSGNYVEIKSPMIGTFYRASGPDVGSFVNIGDSVQKGSVVCIVEAMKLFNEIESEVSGKIVKVLVDNASPVEYDQPLFLVDPS